jgi:hypothetical protein
LPTTRPLLPRSPFLANFRIADDPPSDGKLWRFVSKTPSCGLATDLWIERLTGS